MVTLWKNRIEEFLGFICVGLITGPAVGLFFHNTATGLAITVGLAVIAGMIVLARRPPRSN